ncbi:biotin-dependent carboxyltransferase family protein [Microlunatus sp. Gsoil 973]|uniref:5-oxoprolinase subunit C family protein n=1 Tax=Microlunatus sp. Gsoil 973 TaxID=2672569 RepID=UPI0012B501BA|nr:biotin-dependent carboxyltransferase family protein [Microlunatus sp. Gsoil 973]QGN35200.1 5-oxoprolinase/urea amidolyase family protein [Microlunatus sp. Gsoil 973]
MIIIEQTGPLALIEDLGRSGYAHLGVPPSGAADRHGLRAANRLVGNPEGFAAIEVLHGGLVVSTERPIWAAVAGATTTLVINARPDASHHAVHLRPGDRLEVRAPTAGLRNYLAVRGGIDVPPVLGSRSADLLSGLGPAPLQPGTRLPVGRTPLPFPHIGLVRTPPSDDPLEVALTPGPRTDWLTPKAVQILADRVWTVSNDSDRTGVRLQGAPLGRRVTAELPSEGIIRGAVQVPPSGLPLIFGSDHPVTGGYPVVGVVPAADCDRIAQLRPGDGLRLRWRASP